jgi:endonuclease/exonuclease/phosphatase family metal-dependent hydrolase
MGAVLVVGSVAGCSSSESGPFGTAGPTASGAGGGSVTSTTASGTGAGGASTATGGGAGVGGAGATRHLRVLTINLLTFITGGSADERTQIVADAVTQLEPDFVALQEIAQSLTVDNRAEALAMATGYEWGWQLAHDFGLYQEGTGYLSRWPVAWTESLELPHGDLGGTVKRFTVGAGIETPHGTVHFFSSHATLDSDPSKKADQARASWQLLHDKDNGLPAILAGDMNATPETLAMQFLRGDASHAGDTGDLVDAWIAANGAAPGLTNPSGSPDKRIDYVYLWPGGSASVVSCELVFDQQVGGLYASDHLGVMCDIAF